MVSLSSAILDASLRIRHNYLEASDDRQSMTADPRAAMDVAGRPAMRKVITGNLDVPASNNAALLARSPQDRSARHTLNPTCVGNALNTARAAVSVVNQR